MTSLSRSGRSPRRTARLVLIAGLLAVAGCGSSDDNSDEPRAKATGATAERFAAAAKRAVPQVEQGSARLLDVRRRDEWNAGHAAQARLFPLASLKSGRLPEIDKTARLFVYCSSGRRAAIAVKILRNAGFRDVTNIGGLDDWRRAGGKTTPRRIGAALERATAIQAAVGQAQQSS